MNRLWTSSLLRRRFARMAGATLGVALTVALAATLGFFLIGTSASMTQRAVASVPIDWQVEVVPGADAAKIADAIAKAAPVDAIHRMLYAQTQGFQATTAGAVQTTGPGNVIPFDATYLTTFPKEMRLL